MAACGGSGGTNNETDNKQKNKAPVAIDDSVSIWVNETAPISVISNDSDSNGDNLSITEISKPANGVATFSDKIITYTPNSNFIGYDNLFYIVSDSKGGSSSANITITIESISSPNVKYPQKPYELFAHYGSVSSLLASANESGEVNVNSISHFTTAEYELLNQINQDPIVTEQTLSDIQQKLDYDYVIDLAATANIIISDNGLNLPERFNSINDFMQLPFEISKELGKWRIHNNQEYFSL